MTGPKWKFAGDPASPGFWESADGRFSISPEYMGTTRPQGYALTDNTALKDGSAWRYAHTSHNTVRECKQHAKEIALRKEPTP